MKSSSRFASRSPVLLGVSLSLTLAVALSAAGCSSEAPSPAASGSARSTTQPVGASSSAPQKSAAAPSPEDPKVAWSKRPKKTVEYTLKTIDGVAYPFTIDLVDGFEVNKPMTQDDAVYYTAAKTGGAWTFDVVVVTTPDDLDAMAARVKQRDTILKQEKLPDGYLIHAEDGKESTSVKLALKSGGAFLLCTASLTSVDGAGPNKSAILAWLESMCRSMKPKK